MSALISVNFNKKWSQNVYYTLLLAGKCCDEAETACTQCGHQGVVRGQLQKTEAPDRLTGIASLTEDQSDASSRCLGMAYGPTGGLG